MHHRKVPKAPEAPGPPLCIIPAPITSHPQTATPKLTPTANPQTETCRCAAQAPPKEGVQSHSLLQGAWATQQPTLTRRHTSEANSGKQPSNLLFSDFLVNRKCQINKVILLVET